MAQPPLSGLSEAERNRAFERFKLLRPFLEQGVPLARVASDRGLALRTARRWAARYHREGLAGLARKGRSDRGKRRLSDTLRQAIEGLALSKPPLSAASIHRQAVALAEHLGEAPPGYDAVYHLVRALDPPLLTLAHQGTKAYADTFDLLYRHEATGPNAVWQADHTELDIVLKDGRGRPEKPWLTVILDDYSRAVAGYALFFGSPSAIQTALALRQAIWRKGRPGWQVCGIPGILYSDHGSDFTSRHLEQVAADLKIRLVNSGVGRPRGRGKIERFFESVSQVLLPRLPGYAPAAAAPKAELTLTEMTSELERFVVEEYHNEPHTTTGFKPHERWTSGGFLPRMPESLEQLDLLLLTVPKTRRVHPDGIRFSGLRYIDPLLAAYVGEEVLLRYDPRDITEVRVFHEGRFVCRAVCQELAGETVPLREVIRARERRRRELRRMIQDGVFCLSPRKGIFQESDGQDGLVPSLVTQDFQAFPRRVACPPFMGTLFLPCLCVARRTRCTLCDVWLDVPQSMFHCRVLKSSETQ
jgi:putative transposase